MTGLAGSIISDIELGKRQAWPKARRTIAEALGMPEKELFPENSSGKTGG